MAMIFSSPRCFGGSHVALVVAILAGGAAVPAFAQTTPGQGTPGQAPAVDDANATGDIVVTAQRREQRLQDVPLSVTAISGATLAQQGALTFESYAAKIPSLSFQYVGPTGYRGARNYALRGINGTNTVGFYIDDTPVPLVDPELLDVARIEVLRGPQATLYGSNSMGGTIKFVTNRPEFNKFSGSIEGQASVTDGGGLDYRGALVLNVPLVDDMLAARLSYSHREDSGFIDNYYDGYPGVTLTYMPVGQTKHGVDKNWNRAVADNARLTLRFEPSNGLTFTPSVLYSRTGLDNAATFFGDLPGTKVVRSLETPESERTWLTYLNIGYATEKFNVTSILSYFDKRALAVEDTTQFGLGYTPAVPYSLDTAQTNKNLTYELRGQTTFSGPVNFVLGGLYARSQAGIGQSIISPGISANNPGLPAVPDDLFVQVSRDTVTKEKSLFGEVIFDLTRALQITGGLRYYNFRVDDTLGIYGLIGTGTTASFVSKDHGVRPRVTVSWKPSRDLTIFSNYGKGFRPGFPGGARASICGGGRTPDVVSDTVTNYEVGAKVSVLDRRLQLSGTVYRMDWKGVQQTVLLPCGYLETANTGVARSEGVEFEFNSKLADGFTLDGAVTYTDAKITEAQVGAPAAVGAPILFVPKWKIAFGAQFERPLSSQWTGFARADLDYESRVLIDYGTGFERGGYGTIAAHIGVRRGDLSIEIFGRNLTNQRPETNLYTFAVPPGSVLNSTIRPRVLGIKAGLGF